MVSEVTLILPARMSPALADMSTTTATVVSAIAAIVGALGGGLAGGMFALRAVQRQLAGDLVEKRADESHKAAMDVAYALGPLDKAFQMKEAGQQSDLQEAADIFAMKAGTLIIAIADPDLRKRIWDHVHVSYQYAQWWTDAVEPYISPLGMSVQFLAGLLIGQSNELREAISAHFDGKPLPEYKPPPSPIFRQAPGQSNVDTEQS